MKILHVAEYAKGGIATYLNELVTLQLEESDLDIYIACSKNKFDLSLDIEDSKIKKCDYSRGLLGILKYILFLNKVFKEVSPDIIHIHSTYAGFMARVLFIFKKRPKIIYCSHGWAFLMKTANFKKKAYSIIEYCLSFLTDKIINISNYEQEKAIEYGIPKEKCIRIYNGINKSSDLVCEDMNDINIKLSDNDINLLFVGRYDFQKGLDILFKVFNSDRLNQNIKLFTIGDYVIEESETSSLLNNFPSNITNIGWVDNYQLPKYYSKFDAIIMPSRWEGFGLVAIEAMKYSKPVIASNKGALPEIVIDKISGYLINVEENEDIVSRLNGLEKENLIELGKQGRILFEKTFSSKRMSDEIKRCYLDIYSN